MIYIVGHKKPDLDSITAAIAYAEFKSKTEAEKFIAARAGEINPETSHILKKFKIKPPVLLKAGNLKPSDQVILVDHNEESQRMDGLDPSQIAEIIDHHRVDLTLASPIKILTLPWGSSATIIFSLAQQNRMSFSTKTAKLMLAAILSDTLGLKGPTTTEHDRDAVKKLKKIAGIKDVEASTFEIFKAKSNIEGFTPKQVVTNDYKTYDFSGEKVFISQLETVEQEKILKEKETYIRAMEEVKKEQNLDLIFFAVTDPLKHNTKMLYSTADEQTVLEKAFATQGKNGIADIGPKVSRKKEMAPQIEEAVGTLVAEG